MCDIHNKKCTNLKCRTWWIFLQSNHTHVICIQVRKQIWEMVPQNPLLHFWSHYPSTLPKQVLLLSWFYIIAFPLYEFFLMESYGIYFFFGGWHMLKLWEIYFCIYSSYSHCKNIPQFIYLLLVDTWVVFGFWLLQIMLLWT